MLFAASSDSMRARRVGSSDMGAVRKAGNGILRLGVIAFLVASHAQSPARCGAFHHDVVLVFPRRGTA
jgi:hypothetical protein